MSIKSFIEIVNDYKGSNKKIEIPNIQRDYVQGRDTEQAKEKINKFVISIVEHLIKNEKMPLNFVYGYKNNSLFIPIDGQQRLTTLYLFHLYVWEKAGKSQELTNKDVFNYKVRPSSNRFLKALRENLSVLNDSSFQGDLPIAKMGEKISITNYEDKNNDLSIFLNDCVIVKKQWFRKCWLNDLTVRSCIIVLYLIKEAFKTKNGVDFNKIYNNLNQSANNATIYFQYKEIEDVDRANETYVKMNARGKQLTSFENLKAELYGFFKTEKIDNDANLKDFKKKIDSNWLLVVLQLIMGNYKVDNSTEIDLKKMDPLMFRIFNIIVTSNYLYKKFESTNDFKNEDIKKDLSSYINDSVFSKNTDYIILKDYKANDDYLKGFDEKTVNDWFKTSIYDFYIFMNSLSCILKNDDRVKKICIVFSEMLKEHQKEDDRFYNERLLIYSIILFLKNKNVIDNVIVEKEKYLLQWIKMFKCILSHSEIDDPEKFIQALKLLAKVDVFNKISDTESLYKVVGSYTTKTLLGTTDLYNQNQIDDEIRKAKRRYNNSDWEEAISKYEWNERFIGQSIFLNDNSTIDTKLYKSYWDRTIEIFKNSEEKIKEKPYTLLALFSVYKLISLDGAKSYSFGYNDTVHYTYEWRGIFENKDYVKQYKQILDELNASGKSYEVFKQEKCKAFLMPDYQSKPQEFLQYVLAQDYKITWWFAQGRYIENKDASLPYVKYELLKKTSVNRDDKLDLSMAYILLKYYEKGFDTFNIPINYENNHVIFSKSSKTIDVKFDGLTGKYLFNKNDYGCLDDVLIAIDKYIS